MCAAQEFVRGRRNGFTSLNDTAVALIERAAGWSQAWHSSTRRICRRRAAASKKQPKATRPSCSAGRPHAQTGKAVVSLATRRHVRVVREYTPRDARAAGELGRSGQCFGRWILGAQLALLPAALSWWPQIIVADMGYWPPKPKRLVGKTGAWQS